MGVELIMVALMGYQVLMPAVDNGHYSMVFDGTAIVRMNTQDGSMERCDKNLKCEKVTKDEVAK